MRYTKFMGWIIDLIHKGERVCLITILDKEEIINYINATFKGWTIKYYIGGRGRNYGATINTNNDIER